MKDANEDANEETQQQQASLHFVSPVAGRRSLASDYVPPASMQPCFSACSSACGTVAMQKIESNQKKPAQIAAD